VAAICDAQPGRLETVGRTYRDAALVGSVEQLLELGLDAVAIATPVGTHFPLASRCLEAGLHVLVEKPLAATTGEAEALVTIAQRAGRVLMVDHTYLFSNPVRLIKRLVDAGELGELLYVDSVRINLGLFQRDVNVVWDLAPHDFSIIDHVLGPPGARSISAWGCGHVDPQIEDVAYVNLDYGARLLANIHVNWLSPVKVRQMIFAGTRRSLIFNELNTAEPVKVYDRGIELSEGGDEAAAAQQTLEQRRRLLVSYRSGDVLSPQVEPGEALQAVVRHFAECVREGKTPLSDGRVGLRVVRLLEAATRSVRAQGGRVVLEAEGSTSSSNGNGENHARSGGNGGRNGNGTGDGSPADAGLPADRAGRPGRAERQHPLLRQPVWM
jgi:predicted dehydrogenase